MSIAAIRNLSNVKLSPPSVLFYGVYTANSLFILIPVYMYVMNQHLSELVHANITYACIILTYIGAVRWGVAIPEIKEKKLEPTFWNMTLAIVPSCIAWLVLLQRGQSGEYLLLIGAFIFHLIQDLSANIYPPWYKSKQIILETSAILSLMATYMLSSQ